MEDSDKKYSVLYAEDDDNMRRSYVQFLKEIFRTVYEAGDGEEALKIYYEYKPDVIVADISMPKLDGLSLTKRIRENDRKTKVIILTAFIDQEKLLLATELHLMKYLEKPVRINVLQDVLFKAIHEIEEESETMHIIKLKGGFVWNKTYKRLLKEDEEIPLTRSEITLMECLVASNYRTLSYQDIMYHFWEINRDKELTENSLKAIIKRLRKKLADGSIENIFGVGYRLVK